MINLIIVQKKTRKMYHASYKIIVFSGTDKCIYFRTDYTWYCTCGSVYYWLLSRVCIYYKYAFHWCM